MPKYWRETPLKDILPDLEPTYEVYELEPQKVAGYVSKIIDLKLGFQVKATLNRDEKSIIVNLDKKDTSMLQDEEIHQMISKGFDPESPYSIIDQIFAEIFGQNLFEVIARDKPHFELEHLQPGEESWYIELKVYL